MLLTANIITVGITHTLRYGRRDGKREFFPDNKRMGLKTKLCVDAISQPIIEALAVS